MNSDLAKARDKWLNGSIGQKCCEGAPRGQYLQHRLEAAFIAGWDACAEAIKKALKGG